MENKVKRYRIEFCKIDGELLGQEIREFVNMQQALTVLATEEVIEGTEWIDIRLAR